MGLFKIWIGKNIRQILAESFYSYINDRQIRLVENIKGDKKVTLYGWKDRIYQENIPI